MMRVLFFWTSVVVFFSGCKMLNPQRANIAVLYNQSAQDHGPDRNPIIVIPGILGSKLVDDATGKMVWGAFSREAAHPKKPEDARSLALPMRLGVALVDLKDSTLSDGALDRLKVSLWLASVQPKAYAQLLATLGAGGYRDSALGESGEIDYGNDHYTCFQFDYDWRRSCAENARLLSEFIEEKRSYVTREREKRFGPSSKPVRFDVVAHSMGGLVARYYLRYGGQALPADGSLPNLNWAGAKEIEKLVLVATPNAGSAESLLNLNEGMTWPLLADYDAALLGTMPAIYELLPRARHGVVSDASTRKAVDLMSLETWEKYQWGMLADGQAANLERLLPAIKSEQQRREVAMDHIAKSLVNAKRFHAALDRPAELPDGTHLTLFAGDSVATDSELLVDSSGLKISKKEAGDGTVARYSALMDERKGHEFTRNLITPIDWDNVTFLFESHLGLTKNPEFADNLLYLLLEEPR
ncbi:MAG: hypothetical protein QM496_08575 [Verrucomicrobiota bacterium]